MAKVIGLGGIFVKVRDPAVLSARYAKHLGLDIEAWGGASFAEDLSCASYTL